MAGIMTQSPAPWRLALIPAKFRGVDFHMENAVFAGGRRIAVHEYPKRDTPYGEDLGRRARRLQIVGYIVGTDYHQRRDLLKDALEIEGAGLVRVQQGDINFWSLNVVVEHFSVVETRERGGYCVFEMGFVEVGITGSMIITTSTQQVVNDAANNVDKQAETSFNTPSGI